MAKNENGYPTQWSCKAACCNSQGGSVGGVTDTERPSEGCSENNGNVGGATDTNRPGCGNGCGNNGSSGDLAPDMNGSCGGRGDCLDGMAVAYVYAPDQKFRLLYSASDALSHGTLFEELYKPMGVYGNE